MAKPAESKKHSRDQLLNQVCGKSADGWTACHPRLQVYRVSVIPTMA